MKCYHVVVSLSIIFTTGCPLSLHCLWLFSCWLGQCLWSFGDHFLGRISLNSVSATSSEFCEWVQVGIDVYIPRWKYQVKSHSSPWFLAACAATIVHRNHFFNLYQKYQTSESKQSSVICKLNVSLKHQPKCTICVQHFEKPSFISGVFLNSIKFLEVK